MTSPGDSCVELTASSAAGRSVLPLVLACLPLAAWSQGPEWPTAQLAPSGYSGAINTPSADVLPWGGAGFSLTNSNPERARSQPAGSFGSLNAGFGVLPGLELVGRLAYEGDLHCYSLRSGCTGKQRDLSLSGKYQLPFELPLGTRVALGFTDYGGAATNYRQVYGVATGTWGPIDLSLGYSKPKSVSALMDGPFGSAVLRIDERWAAALEHDTRAARLGVHYSQPIYRDLALQLGASRKLSDSGAQQPWQLNAALKWSMGRVPAPAAVPQASALPAWQPAPAADAALPVAQDSSQAAAAGTDPAALAALTPDALAAALKAKGFAQIQVRHWPAQAGQAALWQVEAESRRWRQNQLDALGIALSTWLARTGAAATDELLLTLTWQRQPVLHAYTSANCLAGWVGGATRCALVSSDSREPASRALLVSRKPVVAPSWVSARVSQPAAAVASESAGPAWMPQFEIGPALRTSVGTEVGLLDHSLALELGTEVNLAPGLFLQGVAAAPLSNSSDYAAGGPFAASRYRGGIDSALLSYWKPLPGGVSAQASLGSIDRNRNGVLGEAVWMNGDGRWRLSGSAGSFEYEPTGRRQTSALGSMRWSLLPGGWHLEATAGRFLGGDQGYRISSNHWFGDTLLRFYYRDSQVDNAPNQSGRHKFLGFALSLPIGPKAAQEIGPVSLRGSDRFSWGLETKIKERDNQITQGYGLMPRVRHGLMSDVTDHDRNGEVDLLANSARLRALLAEQLPGPR